MIIFAKKANKYVFDVALPVMLFKDIASADMTSQFDLKFVLYCMLVTIFMFSVIWVLTEIFMKDDTMKGSFVQARAVAVRLFLEWHLYRICIQIPDGAAYDSCCVPFLI